ncbi:MAG: DUF1501 domain-containing protein, partial [Planctomycetales bacterium]|nr:DUF1501 domain-containing protein [Planctomycetales bacterium]
MSTGSSRGNFCRRTRREVLWQTGAGFGAVALSSMLGSDFFASSADAATSANPLAAKPPHFAPQAKSV